MKNQCSKTTKKEQNKMTNQEIASTLRKAAETEENLALKMLLIIAAERLEQTP
jgi:hypothetical protein